MTCRGAVAFQKTTILLVLFCYGEAIKTIKTKPEHFLNNTVILRQFIRDAGQMN